MADGKGRAAGLITGLIIRVCCTLDGPTAIRPCCARQLAPVVGLEDIDLSTMVNRWSGWRPIAITIAMIAAPLNCEAHQWPCTAGTSVVSISPGCFTGAELNALSDDQLGMYAAGYVDALQAATMIGVTEPCRKALQTCAIGRGRADLVAAIREYLRKNPNRWDERSNNILYNALFSHCLRQQ